MNRHHHDQSDENKHILHVDKFDSNIMTTAATTTITTNTKTVIVVINIAHDVLSLVTCVAAGLSANISGLLPFIHTSMSISTRTYATVMHSLVCAYKSRQKTMVIAQILHMTSSPDHC
jgi:hypothetical protein